MSGELVVFLGPSLPAAEARRLAPCTVLPPARQGDVWRALERRPRVIALIDGVFEAAPSVWHHELLAALAAGVRVFGGASMGALRAAELHPFGMQGVGEIFRAYRAGRLRGDDEVALLHADAEHAFRPLTVPLVNVRHAAAVAARAGRIGAAQARRLIQVAARIHYQERRWPDVLAAAGLAGALGPWLRRGAPDLKAQDARACLRAAAKALGKKPPPRTVDPRAALGSSLLRQRRLHGSAHAPVLARLRGAKDASVLAERGLRRMLLSAWARARGLAVDGRALREERRRWLDDHARGDDEAFLRDCGLDEASLHVLLEDVLLERAVLASAQRFVSDGPSFDEALAAQARLSGAWAALSRRTSGTSRGPAAPAPPSRRGGGARARPPRGRRGS